MGEQFYLHKPDFNILTSNDDIHSNSRNVTSKILAEADNVLDVIRKIEEYNSDNNLSLNKRINYSIGLTSKVYLSVLKAYFVNNDKSLVVVTGEANGHTSLEYEKNSKEYPKMTSGKNAVSTHIIPIEEIVDIVFGSYDPEKVKIFEDIKEINNMSEREAVRILTELLNDMNTLNSAGMYKDFIKKFNIVFNKYALDTVDYNYNLYAYNIYVKVVSLYLTVIKEIYTSYEYYSKNSNKDYRNRFIFMDIVDIDSLQVILENQNDRRAENTLLEQIVFGYEDLEILAKILEIEFIELDVEFNIENMNPEKNNRVYKKSIIIDASSGIEYTPTPSGPTGPVDPTIPDPDPTIPDPDPDSIEKIAYMKVRHSNDESGNNLYPNQLVLYAIEIDKNNMGESIIYDKDLSWEDSSQTMLNSMLNNWYTDNNIPLVNRINVSTFNSEFTDNEFVYVFNDDNTVEFHQFDDWVEMNDGYIWKSNELDTIDSPGWSDVTVKKQTTFDVCSRYTLDQYKSNFIYKTKTGIIQGVETYSDITTGQPLDNSNIFIENNNLPVIDNQSFRNEMGYVKEQFMSLLIPLKEIHYYSWGNAMYDRNSALKSKTLYSFTVYYKSMMLYLNSICDMSGPTRDNINTFISYLNTVTTTKAYVTSNYNTQFNEIISGMNTFLSGFISSLGTHISTYRGKVTKFRDILSNILNRPSLESMKFYLNSTEVTDYISDIKALQLPTGSYYGGTTQSDPVYILLRNGIDLDRIITSTSINNAIPSILSTLNSSTDLTSWYNNNKLSSNDYIQGLSSDIYKQTPSISTPPDVSSPEDDIDIKIRYTFNIDGTVNKEFIDID